MAPGSKIVNPCRKNSFRLDCDEVTFVLVRLCASVCVCSSKMYIKLRPSLFTGWFQLVCGKAVRGKVGVKCGVETWFVGFLL